ncbi:ABC transporter substrate-binding protein [Bifidobacterium pullorum]|uniref:ABC transporter substrate-binding protein n=1 Tax=Bifidobacterium pullorum TaxID=78448 RepID=UPI000529A645|nr:sugar ABC transporter substrate-binding protein [Bifidobacterium pullorum]
MAQGGGIRKTARRIAAWAAGTALLACASGCGSAVDTRTAITVWSWEPSMQAVVSDFEAANPDIRVEVDTISGYDNLNHAIQDGYNLPDVVQLEYFALGQYAVSGQLLDITERVSSYAEQYTPGTWSSVQMNGTIYALPMDSGPMAFFYNEDVFRQAGVDAASIRTWEDYYEAAKKLKEIGVYITADAGDASFFNAMVWLAGGRPFLTSDDGKTVTVCLNTDDGVSRFAAFWQRMIDEGLVDTRLTTWSDEWKAALGSGQVASLFSGAWMPSLLLADVPGGSGLWRVATMPTEDGSATNAENGGSAMGVLRSSRKPEAAFRFVDYVCHDAEGIATRVAGGAFPADNDTLSDEAFLNKTTITDSRGIDIPYFGGQQFNKVLAQAAREVSVGYQYLPFEVYARDDFRDTVGTAYQWSTTALEYALAEERSEESGRQSDGDEPPEEPGTRVSIMDGIALWQRDLLEYGTNQGFTMGSAS